MFIQISSQPKRSKLPGINKQHRKSKYESQGQHGSCEKGGWFTPLCTCWLCERTPGFLEEVRIYVSSPISSWVDSQFKSQIVKWVNVVLTSIEESTWTSIFDPTSAKKSAARKYKALLIQGVSTGMKGKSTTNTAALKHLVYALTATANAAQSAGVLRVKRTLSNTSAECTEGTLMSLRCRVIPLALRLLGYFPLLHRLHKFRGRGKKWL